MTSCFVPLSSAGVGCVSHQRLLCTSSSYSRSFSRTLLSAAASICCRLCSSATAFGVCRQPRVEGILGACCHCSRQRRRSACAAPRISGALTQTRHRFVRERRGGRDSDPTSEP